MTPGSYAADFSAQSSISSYYSDIKIIYTTDATAADDFFKADSKITSSNLNSASAFKTAELNLTSNYESYSKYNLSGSFKSDSGALTPSTTYYYRLAYYAYDSSTRSYTYYFLTAPDQFTTKEPVEEVSISIKDITVEEIGYQKAKVVWTIDNPNNEIISNHQLVWTDGKDGDPEQKSSARALQYRDSNSNEIPGKYYAYTDNMEWAKEAKVAVTTYLGNNEQTIIESESVTLTPQNMDAADISLTTNAGSASFQATVELSPFYAADNGLRFTLYYWPENETSGSAASTYNSMYVSGNQTSAIVSLSSGNLKESTNYRYYIEPAGRLGTKSFDSLGSKENPLSFTTKQVVTYTDADFPDEVFRNYIKSKIGNASSTITSDKLEKLTSISCNRSNASGDINSLEGIEYLENLTSIYMEGHSITNAGGLSSLTKLTSINLNSNDLTQLPDMSGMNQLTSANFDDNLISADSITADKVPASLYSGWINSTIANQRRADVAITFALEYYASGEARPFLVKIEGLKKDYSRKYTLSLTIDGKTVSSTPTSRDYNDMYFIKDILMGGAGTGISVTEGTSCEASVTLTDSYGHTWVDNKTEQVTFTGGGTPVVKTQSIKSNASSVNISIDNLPSAYAKENITSLTLVDEKGEQVGSASLSNIYTYESYTNPYEDVFGYFSISSITDSRNLSLSASIYFSKYLTAGEYKAVITLQDGTSVTFNEAVYVDGIAILNNLYSTNGNNDYYDNYGDYLYVRLEGTNIDPEKVYPVLYSEDGKPVTEYVNSMPYRYEGSFVYKLRKLEKETCWNFSGSKTFSYDFTALQGYEYLCSIKNKRISVYLYGNDFVTFEHYNYKKGIYEVKTDSTAAEGTKVSVAVYNANSYDAKAFQGTAEGTVTNSLLSLVFTDAQGEKYAPPKDRAAYFRYTYTDEEGKKVSFDHSNSSVKWYNYYTSGTGSYTQTPYTDIVLYHKALLKELDMDVFIPVEQISTTSVVTAQITAKAMPLWGTA